MDKVTLQIASLAQREAALKRTIASLIDQVDFIRVALNGYEAVPDWLVSEKIDPILCDNSLMDGHRFVKNETNEGYILFCDDDIEYPRDFVGRLKSHHYNMGRCIVSVMGKNLHPGLTSYARQRHERFSAFEYVSELRPVQIIGMCGALTHSNYFRMTTADVKVMNSDINASAFCEKHRIARYVVPHLSDWCTDLMVTMPPDAFTIWTYNTDQVRDEEMTAFIKNIICRIDSNDDLGTYVRH